MILLIDNYDSFTYNLYQYAGMINPDIKVVRNDKITIDEIKALNPEYIIISPGPGYPKDAGISIEVIKQFGKTTPILGICLGNQSIGEAFGGKVVKSPYGPVHGKASEAKIDNTIPVFYNLPNVLKIGRYHSLVVDKDTLPSELLVTAKTADGMIMGLAHKRYPIYGIQFHPESILTDYGLQIIKNFLSIKRRLFYD